MHYNKGRRSMWDVIGERRKEAERLAELNKPKGDFSPKHVIIENAWAWLPAIQVSGPLAMSDLINAKTDSEHSSQLVDASGKRRHLLRLPQTSVQSPEVRALPRAVQLLRAMLAQWQEFASGIDWPEIHVVLFAPSDLISEHWLDTVIKEPPFTIVPKEKVVATAQPFANWLDETLKSSTGADQILCLSIDSWATEAAIKRLAPGQVAGETITALKLRRVSQSSPTDITDKTLLFAGVKREHGPRTQQLRNDTDELDQLVQSLCVQTDTVLENIRSVVTEGRHSNNRLQQMHEYLDKSLPRFDRQDQIIAVSTLCGQTGEASTQITGIALASLTTTTEPGTATLILDRESETMTQGWLIAR